MLSSSCQQQTQEAIVSTGRVITLLFTTLRKKSQVISGNRFKTYFPSLAIQYDKFKDIQNMNLQEDLIVKLGFLAKLLRFFPKCSIRLNIHQLQPRNAYKPSVLCTYYLLTTSGLSEHLH